MLFRPKPPILDKVKFPRNPRLPIDLAYASICLKKYGYKPFLLDCQVNPGLDPLEYSEKSDAIVISCTYFDIDNVIRFSKKVKSRGKNRFVVVIGQQATAQPEKFVYEGSPIDLVLQGETEKSLVELFEKLNQKEGISTIKCLYSNKYKGDKIEMIHELDKLPFPEYIPGYNYIYPIKIRKKAVWGHLLSTRGCPHPCIFCSQMSRKTFGAKLRSRSGKNVAEEFAYLKRKGITVILFDDDNFTTNREHILDVCKAIQYKAEDTKWVIHARIDELDEETISEMKKANCILLRLGIESGSNRIIKLLKKRHKDIDWVCQTKKVASIANEIGIPMLGLFMVGNPEETEKDILNSMNLAKELNFDLIQVHFFAPYYGTLAYDDYKDKIRKENVYHHACQDIEISKIPNEKLKKLYRRFFYGFYLRPVFLIKHIWSYRQFYILNISSWSKLINIVIGRRLS